MADKNEQPLRIQQSAEELCAKFRAQSSAPAASSIEQFLQTEIPDETDRSKIVLRLIQVEIELRRQAGESPDKHDYVDRFPKVNAHQISDLFSLPAPPPPAVNKPILPLRYRVYEEIGRGGIGTVWRVHDKELDRPLAIKVLHDRYKNDPGANARLDREALLTGSLQHPGIPPVHERGRLVSGSSFFAMKLVGGETLAQLLMRRNDASDDLTRCVGIFQQVAQTIAYAHSRQIIHRDLKPQNIMVGEFGEVQIMDWGMAKVMDGEEPTSSDSPQNEKPEQHKISVTFGETAMASLDSSMPDPMRTLTRQGDVFGTPAYMPPEQARGDLNAMDERSDVFGLGAILFEILTGLRLYDDVSSEDIVAAAATSQLAGSFKKLDESTADDELLDLCRRCLSSARDDRPANGNEVAEAMSHHLESVEQRLKQAEIDRSNAEVKAAEEVKRRRLASLLAMTVVATVLIGILATVWYQSDQSKKRAANDRRQTSTLVEGLAAAPTQALPYAIADLRSLKQFAVPMLQKEYANTNDEHLRFKYAVALAGLAEVDTGYLVDRIADVPAEDLRLIVDAFRADESSSQMISDWYSKQTTSEIKARYAMVALSLENKQPIVDMLGSKMARDRIAVIELAALWRSDPLQLYQLSLDEDSELLQHATLCALAMIPVDTLKKETLDRLVPAINSIYLDSEKAGSRAAADLILRRWNVELPVYKNDSHPNPGSQWFANSIGMVMVEIPMPYEELETEVFYGGYTYYLADREVTISQYLQFLSEDKETASRLPDPGTDNYGTFEDWVKQNVRRRQFDPQTPDASDDVMPIGNVGVYDAMRFCNWLSRREGLTPAYEDMTREPTRSRYGQSSRMEVWRIRNDANGYRLPTFNESYYATYHDHMGTHFSSYMSVGNSSLLKFDWISRNATSVQPVATRLPNRFGVFDLNGNMAEVGELFQSVDTNGNLIPKATQFGKSFLSPRFDKVFTSQSYPWSSLNTGEEYGFRVVRCERDDALVRGMSSLCQSYAMALRSIENEHTDAYRMYGFARLASETGFEFGDLGNDEMAVRCFQAAARGAELTIQNGFRVSASKVHLGGSRVNEAIHRRPSFQFEKIYRLLDEAEMVLGEIAEEDSSYLPAKSFLTNARRVRARTWTDQAFYLSTNTDPEKRDGARALELANDAMDHLGETYRQLSTLAAACAETGDFDSAKIHQGKAISKITDEVERAKATEILRQFEQSEPLRK